MSLNVFLMRDSKYPIHLVCATYSTTDLYLFPPWSQ